MMMVEEGWLLTPWFGLLEVNINLRGQLKRLGDYAMLPGPGRLWGGDWFKWPDIHITEGDVGRWPFSTGALVEVSCLFELLALAK